MTLKRVTTKEGEVYFVDAQTGERVEVDKRDLQNNVSTNTKSNPSISSSLPEINKVVNVTLTGGIIGMLGGAPEERLNKAIKKENQNGWKVVQIIPSDQGNLFIAILRFIILVVTIFLFTPVSGYYVIMEKVNNTVSQIDKLDTIVEKRKW